MIRLFKGTCLAVRAMHSHREVPKAAPQQSSSSSRTSQRNPRRQEQHHQLHEEDEENDERFPQPEGDAEGGYSYGPAQHIPLMTRERPAEVVFDGDDEDGRENVNGQVEGGKIELVPYAHRDLKPG
jgi:serine/threonine kinase 16